MGVKGRKWVKTEARRAYEIRKATLKAEFEMEKRKPFDVSLKEHIGKFIDKIGSEDVIKLGAVVTIAYLIKPVIQASSQFASWTKLLGEPLLFDIPTWFGIIGETVKAQPMDDLNAWLISIGVACLIVLFGPAVISSMKGVVNLAGLFFA